MLPELAIVDGLTVERNVFCLQKRIIINRNLAWITIQLTWELFCCIKFVELLMVSVKTYGSS